MDDLDPADLRQPLADRQILRGVYVLDDLNRADAAILDMVGDFRAPGSRCQKNRRQRRWHEFSELARQSIVDYPGTRRHVADQSECIGAGLDRGPRLVP
jgi:hypothetical protein